MLVILLGFVFFVVKVLIVFLIQKLISIQPLTSHLHSFIIDERIHRARGRLIVRLVGISSELCPVLKR